MDAINQTNPETLSRNDKKPPHFLVIGTGAVGGYYGGQLAKAGATVSTVHHSQADFDAVQKHGIHIHSPDGNYHYRPFSVHRKVPIHDFAADFLLVTVKALPTIDMVSLLRPAIHPKTTIVLLQNGIGSEDLLVQAFPNNLLISGLAFVCVHRESPGHIRHLCYGRVTLGNYPHGSSPQTEQLVALFQASGLPANISENIMEERWKKLVWNIPFNSISVLGHHANTQEMISLEESASLAKNVMREVCRLARAEGYNLGEEVVEKNMLETQKMKPYKTSMLLDFEAGRTLEVEAILGRALQTAHKHAIMVPHLATLHALLKLVCRSSP